MMVSLLVGVTLFRAVIHLIKAIEYKSRKIIIDNKLDLEVLDHYQKS